MIIERSLHRQFLSNTYLVADGRGGPAFFVDAGGPVEPLIAKAEELERNCVPPDSPGHPRKDHTVLQCLHVILKEEWQHHRYAARDLEVLEKRPR